VATWEELSRESLRAARVLVGEEYYRSSISGAYYAAYCAVAGELVARGISFPHGWNNPAHDQIPEMVAHNLPLERGTRRRVSHGIRRLRGLREDADYRPGVSISRADALECLRLSAWVMKIWRIDDD
jgi:uncharacterized protein (UPF0332 family)